MDSSHPYKPKNQRRVDPTQQIQATDQYKSKIFNQKNQQKIFKEIGPFV
jgi:hypothetical protein